MARAIDAECAGDRAHRDAAAVQLDRFSGFVNCEAVLAAHNAVSSEVLGDGCTVHTILLSEITDAETSEVIVYKAIYFSGVRKV